MIKKNNQHAKDESQKADTPASSRRNFIKTIAIGAAAVTTGVVVSKHAKKISAVATAPNAAALDLSKGDAILSQRKYVQMSEEEKKAYIAFLERNYKERSEA